MFPVCIRTLETSWPTNSSKPMPVPGLKIYKHQSFFVVLFVTHGSTSQTEIPTSSKQTKRDYV